jgi:hypothetical protein
LIHASNELSATLCFSRPVPRSTPPMVRPSAAKYSSCDISPLRTSIRSS